ncbi:hypothetical protein [Natrinema sp. DC36]|uniref:hypothetical protein n=1 Tax=Natrinema sp. DC36 TaxID=2878680 RepID=UPI001CEFC3A5|nr:hypothetical protein [Natrinema sp. DC36]
MATEESYDPSFRDKQADERLDEHDARISRLEKGSLIALGFFVAQGNEIADTVIAFI